MSHNDLLAMVRTSKGRAVVPAVENPAVDTVYEHLEVYRVLGSELSDADKREHARRVVDAVLALQVKP